MARSNLWIRFLFLFTLLNGPVNGQSCESCDLVRNPAMAAGTAVGRSLADSLVRVFMEPVRKKLGRPLEITVQQLNPADCDCIANARAVLHRCAGWESEKRFIFFCPVFMDTLASQSRGGAVTGTEFILAHELAHHLMGHSVLDMTRSHPAYSSATQEDSLTTQEDSKSHLGEFEADGYGLFLLYYMYAKKGILLKSADVDRIFGEIGTIVPDTDAKSTTHPSIEHRRKHAHEQFEAFSGDAELIRSEDVYRRMEAMIPNIAFEYMKRNYSDSEDEQIRKLEQFRKEFEPEDNKNAARQVKLATSYLYRNRLDSANYMLHQAKFLTHEEATRSKVANWENRIEKILNRPRYWQLEPLAGLEFVSGRFKRDHVTLMGKHYPIRKAGVRIFRQDWTKRTSHFALDLLYSNSVTDILWEQTGGEKRAAERFASSALEIKPQLILPLGLKRNFDPERTNLRAQGMALMIGRPFYLPLSSQYQSHAIPEAPDGGVKAGWKRYNGDYNILNIREGAALFSTLNWTLMYTRWHRIGRWASYSASFSTYRKWWTVSVGEESFDNRFRVYETAVTLRFW